MTQQAYSYTVELQEGGHEEWDNVVAIQYENGGSLSLFAVTGESENGMIPRYRLLISYPPTVWRSLWENQK